MSKYIRLITLVLATLLAVCLTSSADSVDMDGDEAVYEAPQTIVPPKIDGVLDDAIWQVAPSVTLGVMDTGGTVDEEYFSTAWAVYDSESIYVAFKNLDPNPKNLTCVNVGRDSDTWQDDECELFIEPANVGAEPYFQFCINAECEIFDQERGGAGLPWDSESFKCATKVYDDHWVLEESFSFEDLGIKEAPVGETWGWNFNRHIMSGVDIWTGWSETGPDFHTPSKFGDLTFGTKQMAVRPPSKLAGTWGSIKSVR